MSLVPKKKGVTLIIGNGHQSRKLLHARSIKNTKLITFDFLPKNNSFFGGSTKSIEKKSRYLFTPLLLITHQSLITRYALNEIKHT